MDVAADPAQFLSAVVRALFAPPATGTPALPGVGRARTNDHPPLTLTVPVPLDPGTWSREVFRRDVRRDDLVAAILTDRRAAWLAYGLAGNPDDETLAAVAGTPGLLRAWYERAAPVVAAFSEHVRIRDGRVVPPGGDAAVPLWEAAVGAPVSDPFRFLTRLVDRDRGRLAYLFDLVARLDASHAAFVLGTWIQDPAARAERFAALVTSLSGAYGEWDLAAAPLSRPTADLAFVVSHLNVRPSGAPDTPNSRAFWSAVFQTDDVLAPVGVGAPAASGPIDAAWLLAATEGPDRRGRPERVDQVVFAHRVFGRGAAAESEASLVALRGIRRYRMVLLTLERMGIDDPAVHAGVVRQAARLAGGDPANAFWLSAQFQGAFALVARMTEVGTLDRRAATDLVTSLCAVPLGAARRYDGALAAWVDDRLLPALAGGGDAESRLVMALAGPAAKDASVVSWEGQSYRLDLAAAEIARLRAVRDKQASFTVDLALALSRVARALAWDPADRAGAGAAAEQLAQVIAHFETEIRRPVPTAVAQGVRPIDGLDRQLRDSVTALEAAARLDDPRRRRSVTDDLSRLTDLVLGEAMLSLVYATGMGDPAGTALLGRNVALRHDFGFGQRDADLRARLPWSVPMQNAIPGVPWHVIGSLAGLDLALAPFSLQRLTLDPVDAPPRLASLDRDAFAQGVVLMNPRRLLDEDRDAIAMAIARGRARVADAHDRAAVGQLAEEAAIGGRRRRGLLWTADERPSDVPALFSLEELRRLGGGAVAPALDAWGTAALASAGCPCTQLAGPSHWNLLEGRGPGGALASAVPDLNLHVAVMLHDLALPAALARVVLAAAVQEFVETAAPADADDWWALARAARAVPQTRIEDYVATATVVGGVLVPETDAAVSAP